jgi:plastocyanin
LNNFPKFAASVLTLIVSSAIGAPLSAADDQSANVQLHIASAQSGKSHAIPAVAWLEPEPGTPSIPFPTHGPYTLLQKNRTFIPHLQVIPAGSAVQFPNADPYFHNVFSLFAGKRFDLGLYEAGATKSVTFSRVGVSYIFCNIHPEMSAVVVALSSPLYGIANREDAFSIRNVPFGDYALHIWVEGVPESTLSAQTRRVHISARNTDLGNVTLPIADATPASHSNKFGKPYAPVPKQPY